MKIVKEMGEIDLEADLGTDISQKFATFSVGHQIAICILHGLGE